LADKHGRMLFELRPDITECDWLGDLELALWAEHYKSQKR
jgi:hypothetical protein